MSVAILGSGTFQDLYAPVKGKSEWGMDTLTRRLTGARSLLEAFVASLAQGQIYPPTATAESGYYLQTWEPDDSPNVASVTLNYKGLVTGGTPTPRAISQIVSAVGKTERTFSTEGAVEGEFQGRLWRRDLLWSVTAPSLPGQILGTSIQGFRDRYAMTAIMEFTYRAVQTTYHYVTVGRPFGPRYVFPDIPYPAILERARIVLNDGTVLPRTNWEVFFGLTPSVVYKNISFEASPVIGSPFFECTDVAQQTLGDV